MKTPTVFLSFGLLIVANLSDGSRLAKADDDAPNWQRLSEWTRALSEKYGFEVATAREPYADKATKYQPTTWESYVSFVPVLEESLGRLPVDFLKAAGLRKLVLCGEIEHYQIKYPGLAEPLNSLIYIDVRALISDKIQQMIYDRSRLFHEFYHLVDHDLCYNPVSRAYSDYAWQGLNAADFRYVIDGGERPVNSGLKEPMPGFLTSYCRQAIGEDKSEIFAWLIVRPDLVEAKQADDRILKAKVDSLKETLKKKYPGMDDKFWLDNQKSYHNMRPRPQGVPKTP